METDYEFDMDDFDCVDFAEYADDYYTREIFSQDYTSKYWYQSERVY